MKTCLYCHKDISNKIDKAKYCDMSCGAKYRAMIDIYDDFSGLPTDNKKATHKLIEVTIALQEYREGCRWSRIGRSSSYKAMMEVHKMFK